MRKTNEKWTGEIVGRLHTINVTQKEFAIRCGYSPTYLCMVLNGRKQFESEYAKKFTMRRLFAALELLEKDVRDGRF